MRKTQKDEVFTQALQHGPCWGNTAVFPSRIAMLVSAGHATRAVLYNTGTRVVSLSWAFFGYSGNFSTRVVLHNTGTRVAASVALKFLIFRTSFRTRLCSDYPISMLMFI